MPNLCAPPRVKPCQARGRRLLLACLMGGLAWPTAATTSAGTARVLGQVRDAATQRLLYTEVHDQRLNADGSIQTALTSYVDPQGREMGRKKLDFRANRTVPVFRMDLPAQSYAEGISDVGPDVSAFKLDQGQEQRKRLPVSPGIVAADSGFNQLLLDQMGRIKANETVAFKLIVAGNLDQYQFRARKVADTQLRGETALRIRVEPDSLLRWVVDPIELVYNAAGTRLLQYTGISNVLDPGTGKVFKRVQIDYSLVPPSEKPPSVSQTSVR
jgi:hypothetical protein